MIAGTTSTLLRSGVSAGVKRSCALQPTPFLLLRSSAATNTSSTTTTTYPFSTLPAASFSVRSKLTTSSTLSPSNKTTTAILTLRACQPPASPLRRHASTSSSSSSSDQATDARAAARAAETNRAALDPDAPPLDWNSFFQLRKTRRRWQVGFSALLSLASGAGGAVVLSTGAADALTSQVPLDPVMTMGLMTIGFVALGWLAGPSLGSAVFYLLKRKYKVPMTVKESQFFARIKKNRVDPSNSSTGNPVPDFYGEKISSVAGYRQWLKDQRAYNKKRTTFI